jgi:hypothetical protein
VDLSALIFVALAVAWAVYLIPKALKHHEEAQERRTVEGFSKSMRVLARREPVDARTAALVVPSAPEPERAPIVSRAAAARAAKRRLRVVLLILTANAAVAGCAYFGVVAWAYQAVPAGLLVAWLVACRLMVKKERAAAPARPGAEPTPAEAVEEGPATEEIAAVPAEAERDPDGWDPVPVTLPTYVSKESATRSVRTIDLDSTGVWSSGRNESDSRLAREADQAARTAQAEADAEKRRAAGS